MKRVTYITGLIMQAVLMALLAQSCCKDVKITIEKDSSPIVLSVAQAGTRAVIDDPDDGVKIRKMMRDSYNSSGQMTGGFAVHGFKEVNHVSTKLFDNMRIYPDTTIANLSSKPEVNAFSDVTPWTYTYPRYWDRNPQASYQFIAYWPYVPGQADGSNPYATSPTKEQLDQDYDNRELTLHNIPNWQIVDDNTADYMTAVRVGSHELEFSTGMVSFSFKHILSQLVIRGYYIGRNIESTGGVVIKGIKLNKADNGDQVLSAGQVDFKQRYDDAAAILIENTLDKADSYQLPWGAIANVPIVFKNELIDDPSFTPATINSWLMVPHKWKDLSIQVSYQFGQDAEKLSQPVPITLGAEYDNYKTLPGKRYVITLAFDTTTGGLTVQSVAVEAWTEHDITRNQYNW